MSDRFRRKTYFYQDCQIKEYKLRQPLARKLYLSVANRAFDFAHSITDKIASKHPLYKTACRMQDLVKDSDSILMQVKECLSPAKLSITPEEAAKLLLYCSLSGVCQTM